MQEFYKKEKARFNKGTKEPKLGDQFGKYTVIDNNMYRTEKDNHNWVKVQCECGSIGFQTLYHLNHDIRKGCHECYYVFGARNYKNVGRISSTYFANLKRTAKTRNLDFNLTMTYMNDLFDEQNEQCALSGIKLILFPYKHTTNRNNITASLDRIDPMQGYIIGNVQYVHKEINLMKGCLDNSEFINLCKYIAEFNKDYKDNFEPSQMKGIVKRTLIKEFNKRKLEGATHRE